MKHHGLLKECLFIAVLVVVFLIPTKQATAQIDVDSLRAMWLGQNYAGVVGTGVPLRSQFYNRCAEIDYYLGTSYCRLEGDTNKSKGAGYLHWCLGYPISADLKGIIQSELAQCSSTPGTVSQPTFARGPDRGSAGVGSHSKMFHYLDEGQGIHNNPLLIVDQKPLSVLHERLTPLEDHSLASEKVGHLVGDGFTVGVFGDFVIASSNDKTDTLEMARRLGVYKEFFASTYGLELPPYKITVIVVPESRQLQDLSLNLHGIDLPNASIGYSYRDDMTILALCRYRLTGTLYHELFHLMARSTFGDIPPWLDEGTAALYEVSRITQGGVKGVNNWRGQLLRRIWGARPSIEELIRMDWDTFDQIHDGSHAERQAANHATARCFTQYLQDQGALPEIFNQIRMLTPESCTGTQAEETEKILRVVLGKGLDEIDREFGEWFHNEEIWAIE